MTVVHQIWYVEFDGKRYPTEECFFSYEEAIIRMAECNKLYCEDIEDTYYIESWEVK